MAKQAKITRFVVLTMAIFILVLSSGCRRKVLVPESPGSDVMVLLEPAPTATPGSDDCIKNDEICVVDSFVLLDDLEGNLYINGGGYNNAVYFHSGETIKVYPKKDGTWNLRGDLGLWIRVRGEDDFGWVLYKDLMKSI